LKILAFSFYFPPHGGPGALRPLKLLKYSAPLGAEGVVVAGAEDDYSVIDGSLCAEIPEEFLVLRTPKGADPLRFIRKKMSNKIHAPSSDLIFLPDNKVWWPRPASRLGEIALPEADIVWATCPPFSAGVSARKAAKELGVPLVLDFRDSWTRNPNRKRLPFTHRFINNYIAKKTCSSASLITCAYESIAEEMRELAPNARIEVIPNGFDTEDLPKSPPPISPDAPLRICYLGTIYPDLNYPMPLLRAMRKFDDVKLTVVGRYPDKFIEDVNDLGLSDRFDLKGYRPHREALDICSEHDVLLLYIDNRPLNTGQITSKTYEYIGLGRPILACIPQRGEAEMLLEGIPNAIIADTDNEDAIATALDRIRKEKYSGNMTIAAPPEKFSRKALAERWFELVKEAYSLS